MTARALATIYDGRIEVTTVASNPYEFQEMLTASKRVAGGRWQPGRKVWHYPLAVDTCRDLREAFGVVLAISTTLADWYREAAQTATTQKILSAAKDASLPVLAAQWPNLVAWLRGDQRAGARWIAQGYRGAGLVADMPGVGKTTETLAGIVEAGITGPVLVVCPKSAVRLTWGLQIATHLPGVQTYLCYGSRTRRENVLTRFAQDMADDPEPLRFVVIVAEMLRVELGPPCETKTGGRVSGMCARGAAHGKNHVPMKVSEKKWVPIDFAFPQLFDAELLGGGWSAIVMDESHKLLGSLTVTKGNLMGKGLHYVPERSPSRRIAMSGTPYGKGGRIQGMFGTLRWLWPDEHTSYWRWVDTHFDVEEKVVNRRGLTIKKIVGLRGTTGNDEKDMVLQERFLESLGPRILRRTKAEVLPGLAGKQYAEVVCALTSKQAKQLQGMIDYAEIPSPGGVIMPNGALALLTRSRQIANGQITKKEDGKVTFTGEGSGKITALLQNLEDRGITDRQPGPKLVIASGLNEFLDAIARRLRGMAVGFYQVDGRVSAANRDALVIAWQANTPTFVGHDAAVDEVPRVMLVNTKAAGLSINLDSADEMHIMDEDPDPGVNEQLEDRIHRASREHSVTIFYYRTEGSLDYARAHDVDIKRRAQHAVLDGSRGIEYVRDLLGDALGTTETED